MGFVKQRKMFTCWPDIAYEIDIKDSDGRKMVPTYDRDGNMTRLRVEPAEQAEDLPKGMVTRVLMDKYRNNLKSIGYTLMVKEQYKTMAHHVANKMGIKINYAMLPDNKHIMITRLA